MRRRRLAALLAPPLLLVAGCWPSPPAPEPTTVWEDAEPNESAGQRWDFPLAPDSFAGRKDSDKDHKDNWSHEFSGPGTVTFACAPEVSLRETGGPSGLCTTPYTVTGPGVVYFTVGPPGPVGAEYHITATFTPSAP